MRRLRRQVEDLLIAHERLGEFLDEPAVAQNRRPRRPPAEQNTRTFAGDANSTPGDRTVVNADSAGEPLGFLKPPTRAGSIGRLDHYEILEQIGVGGFGTVFRAFDDRLHRVVAIKVLSPAYAANGSARQRFIREARTAAAVKNEHVVGIYDVEEDAQPPYLAMEMIDGISLQEKLDKTGPLGVKEILRIGMQMPRDWRPPTSRAWSIATSSRRTSCWKTASSASRSPTSAWPAPSMMPA